MEGAVRGVEIKEIVLGTYGLASNPESFGMSGSTKTK